MENTKIKEFYIDEKFKDLEIEDLVFASLDEEIKVEKRVYYYIELTNRMNMLRENKELRTKTDETDLFLYEILDMNINEIECKVHNERRTIYFHLAELAELEIQLKKALENK